MNHDILYQLVAYGYLSLTEAKKITYHELNALLDAISNKAREEEN